MSRSPLGALLLVAACGGAVAPQSTASTSPPAPERIISLSPTATEILFAIGAGDQVVAVDDASNYPKEAPRSELSGITPNLEAIAALEPDLVVASFDPGDLAGGLETLGVSLLIQDAAPTLADAYAQIEQLGVATGNEAGAGDLVATMQGRITELVESSPPPGDRPLTYYHELGDDLYSITSTTFVGEVYRLVGLESIADPADAAGFGYPQLSAEFILAADPDFIFLADTRCCAQNAATLLERQGWDSLTAVQAGRVVELDDDVASRWGPRVVDFLAAITTALTLGVAR